MAECFDQLKENLGEFFSQEELKDVYKAFVNRATNLRDDMSNLYDEMTALKDELVEGMERAEQERKFRFLYKMVVKNRLTANVLKNSDRLKPLSDTFYAYTYGTEKRFVGSRDSFDLDSRVMISRTLDGFKEKLGNAGVFDLWHNKEGQKALADCLKDPTLNIPKYKEMANSVREIEDQLKRELNRLGVFPAELEGRMARNYHDVERLKTLSEDGKQRWNEFKKSLTGEKRTRQEYLNRCFEEWYPFTRPLLDEKKAFRDLNFKDEKEVRRVMKGVFMKQVSSAYGLEGKSSMIQSLLGQRLFNWKDTESELKYIERYGAGTLFAAIEKEFTGLAQDIASLKRFGSDPHGLMASVAQTVTKLDPTILEKEDIAKVLTKTNRAIDAVNGKLNDPNSKIAVIGGNIRAAMMMTKLPKVVLTALSDLAAHSIGARRIYGGFFKAAAMTLKEVFTPMSKAEKTMFADLLKSVVQQEKGGIARLGFSGDPMSPLSQKLVRLTFKLNLLHAWDKSNKTTMISGLSRHMALIKDKSFEDLANGGRWDKESRQAFEDFNITSGEWDIIRGAKTTMDDRKQYILPESLNEVPDEKIRSYLQSQGRKNINAEDIRDARSDIQFKMEKYFQDHAEHAILRPSAYLQSAMVGHTKSGTYMGQLARMMMQFKAYTASYIEKPVAKLLYGNGAENVYQAFFTKGKRGDFLGLAQMIGYASLLGFVGLTADNLMQGYSIPDITDPKTIRDSIAKGGGLSLMGDLALGAAGRFGGGTAGQILGPSAGVLASAADTFIKGPVQGSFSTAQASHFISGNVPIVQQFYKNWIMNYLVINRLQEMSSPGYIDNKRAELQQRNQDFWLPQL